MPVWVRPLIAAAALAVVTTATAGPGYAEPADGDQSTGDCQFTLTAPKPVVLPGGAPAATATLQAGACTGQPTSATVCVTLPNGSSDCAAAVGFTLAQVTVPGPTAGQVTATGTGCWRPALAQPFTCATQGPIAAHL